MKKLLENENLDDLLFEVNNCESLGKFANDYGFDSTRNAIKAVIYHCYEMGWKDCEEDVMRRVF